MLQRCPTASFVIFAALASPCRTPGSRRGDGRADLETLFSRIVRLRPDAVARQESATCDAALSASDVLLLRTADGGHARLLLDREENGRIGVRYAKNPAGPTFVLTTDQTADAGGVSLLP